MRSGCPGVNAINWRLDRWNTRFKSISAAIFLLFSLRGATARQSPSQPGIQVPPSVYTDRGACPFEGCVYRQWTARQDIPLYDRPNGKRIGVLKKGEKVEGLTGMVRTVPNRADVVYPHDKYRTGDVFYVLTYVGEGFAKVWFKGKIAEEDIADMPFEGFNPGGARPLKCITPSPDCWWNLASAKRQSTWWVKVKRSSGEVGWAISNGNFDNQDALG